jgi:hypothetical protein
MCLTFVLTYRIKFITWLIKTQVKLEYKLDIFPQTYVKSINDVFFLENQSVELYNASIDLFKTLF